MREHAAYVMRGTRRGDLSYSPYFHTYKGLSGRSLERRRHPLPRLHEGTIPPCTHYLASLSLSLQEGRRGGYRGSTLPDFTVVRGTHFHGSTGRREGVGLTNEQAHVHLSASFISLLHSFPGVGVGVATEVTPYQTIRRLGRTHPHVSTGRREGMVAPMLKNESGLDGT